MILTKYKPSFSAEISINSPRVIYFSITFLPEVSSIDSLASSNSPVTKIIYEAVEKKIPILGICNGFQILTHMKLLPGKLELNTNKKFTCQEVNCTLS